MARAHNKLMSCLKKRDVLNNSNADPEALIREAEMFLEAGYIQDALDFFAKAGFEAGIKRILAWAVEEGNFFTAETASKALGQDLPSSEWAALGDKALEKRKYHFALKAFTRAGDNEKIETTRKHI
jgi:hypothetical protein